MLSSLLSIANADGVITMNSGNPGPTIGIVAITHGNEIAGLRAFDRLVYEFRLEEQLTHGKVHLIINNIEAALFNRRFIDRDMNRLWNEEAVGYEYERRKVIEPYIRDCDHLLDLHSTTAPSAPMVIVGGHNDTTTHLIDSLAVNYAIENLFPFVTGTGMVVYHNTHHPHGAACVIECGTHTSEDAMENAYENSLRFLSYFGAITYESSINAPKVFSVIDAHYSKGIGNVEYIYSHTPKSFDTLLPHTLVARFHGEDMYSPNEESFLLMPTIHMEYIGDTIMYFMREI